MAMTDEQREELEALRAEEQALGQAIDEQEAAWRRLLLSNQRCLLRAEEERDAILARTAGRHDPAACLERELIRGWVATLRVIALNAWCEL